MQNPSAAIPGRMNLEDAPSMSQLHPVQSDSIMLLTSVIRDRKPIFTNHVYAREAIETLYEVQVHHPFFLYAFVIMPDHCHLLIRVLPPGAISKIMNVFKGCSSMRIGLGSIWQRGFHMKIVQNPSNVLRYIHLNPTKIGLAEKPEDYPWSSANGRWDVSPIDC